MRPVSVLIVDDSPFVREFIAEAFAHDPGIRVAGEAADGKEAVEKVLQLKPDVVTMDIDMPVMGGMAAIENIMSAHPLPILVVTSRADADTAYSAISKGALEVLPKPDLRTAETGEFVRKVKLLAKVRVIHHLRCGKKNHIKPQPASRISRTPAAGRQVVAVAASTGGPKALLALLGALPPNLPCPVVIAQHIARDFVTGMAGWLDKSVPLKVKAGEAGESLLNGVAYISPSEHHMQMAPGPRISFYQRRDEDIYAPSCDRLLTSAASVYGADCIGVVLTGMGDDGAAGIQEIRKAGGHTIAQDEASSVVFGMPRAAIESGCIDRVLSLSRIPAAILSYLERR